MQLARLGPIAKSSSPSPAFRRKTRKVTRHCRVRPVFDYFIAFGETLFHVWNKNILSLIHCLVFLGLERSMLICIFQLFFFGGLCCTCCAPARITSIVEQIYGIGIKGCFWADLSIWYGAIALLSLWSYFVDYTFMVPCGGCAVDHINIFPNVLQKYFQFESFLN